MTDFFGVFLCFVFLCTVLFVVLVGVTFILRLFSIDATKAKNSYDAREEDEQLEKDSKEDSQADLYMSEDPEDYDNLMFPEEPDE